MRASLLSLFFAGAALALPKITRTGKYLYDESGNRFFIKGIAYQKAGTLGPVTDGGFPEPINFVDGLADPAACKRDIPNLQKLSVNAIRVYSVDAAGNHADCMSQLSAAGIYTIIDLSLPVNGSISRATPTWTSNLLNLYLSTIDSFLKYDNVLAFNIGNEVVIDTNSTVSAPFIKAAARDVKAYLKSKSSSALVGYASTDGAGWRDPLAAYLTCDSADTSIDLWGLNDYRWCGATGSVSSSYQESLTSFANLPVAAYFSEYGCNTDSPRTWTEVAAIYGDSSVAQVYSGGVAFSYFPTNDAKDFGLTTLSGDTVTTTVEFDNLVTALTKITTFINTPAKSAATQPAFSTCPPTSDSWTASPNLPPTPNQAACDCTWKVASCIFSPQTANQTPLFSPLFASACTLLSQSGGSCDDINANGATGVYGQFSPCDSATKLTHVFSEFYLATKANAQSCSFAGNATVQSSAPTDNATITSQLTTCFNNPAVFTPSAPTTTPNAIATASGTTTATQKNGGAAGHLSRGQAIAIAATGFVSALGAFVVL